VLAAGIELAVDADRCDTPVSGLVRGRRLCNKVGGVHTFLLLAKVRDLQAPIADGRTETDLSLGLGVHPANELVQLNLLVRIRVFNLHLHITLLVQRKCLVLGDGDKVAATVVDSSGLPSNLNACIELGLVKLANNSHAWFRHLGLEKMTELG